jgi:hypothetical protein
MKLLEWIIKAIGETILYVVKLVAFPFAWLGYVWQKDYQEKVHDLFKPTLLDKKQTGLTGLLDTIYFLIIRIGLLGVQMALFIPSIIVWLFVFKDPVPYMLKYFQNWTKR